MQTKKGISLIVLVITIIVMIILAGAIILTLNNSGIIGKASETVFKQNVNEYNVELSLYISEKMIENPELNKETINSTVETIVQMIPSISAEDKEEFIVEKGSLKYIGANEEKIKWCTELKIEIKTGNTVMTKEEYELKYATQIADALKYGEIIDGVYNTKEEYKPNYGGTWPTDVTEIAIPYGVTTIGYAAFSGCVGIKKVIIPDSVTSIGDSAFNRCTGLKEINLPPNLTTISGGVFQLSGLTTIRIPNKVTSIDYIAFSGCSNLSTIYIPNSVKSISQTFTFAEIAENSIIYVQDEATKDLIKSIEVLNDGEEYGAYNSSRTTIIVDPTKFN